MLKDYDEPEMVEMREAHAALVAAQDRWLAATDAARAAGYRPVGVNRWERP